MSMCVCAHVRMHAYKITVFHISVKHCLANDTGLQQVLQVSLHTRCCQFAGAAVCMQQVLVAPHNSSCRKRMGEG